MKYSLHSIFFLALYDIFVYILTKIYYTAPQREKRVKENSGNPYLKALYSKVRPDLFPWGKDVFIHLLWAGRF